MKEMNHRVWDVQADPPAWRHSETSKAAAESIKEVAGRLRRKVYEYLRSKGEVGATDHEVQAALGMLGSTQRTRRNELQKQGRVEDSGTTRLTPSRCRATVWRIVKDGSKAYPSID